MLSVFGTWDPLTARERRGIPGLARILQATEPRARTAPTRARAHAAALDAWPSNVRG